MFEYKYLGIQAIELMGFGIVNRGDVIKVKFEINHPLFVRVVKDISKKKK